jgi:hypothetical protein
MCIVFSALPDLMKTECIYSLSAILVKEIGIIFKLIRVMVRTVKLPFLVLDKISINLSSWRW